MCPKCHEPLIAYELDGIEVDRCIVCGGTWLDAGELELIAERAGAEPGRLSAALEHAKPKGRTSFPCPRCSRNLRAITVGDIDLERCPHGHGLWFDSGEMRALIAANGEAEEEAIARFFSDLYRFELESETEGGD